MATQRFELVYDDDGLVKVKRYVKWGEGEGLVRAGKARRILRHDGSLIGYELLMCVGAPRSEAVERVYEKAESKASSAALSMAEVEAVVGFFGPSKTAMLSKEQRLQLEANGEEAHDFIEVSRAKLHSFRPRAIPVRLPASRDAGCGGPW